MKEVDALIEKSLLKLTDGLKEIYGNRLVSVILYGSYARGDGTSESDIDIAIIVYGHETPKMKAERINLTVDLELECNRVISVLKIDSDKFKEWGNVLPFYKNVRKDGIVLWQAA